VWPRRFDVSVASLALSHWLAQGREALDALVFPCDCLICGTYSRTVPLCASCRAGLREASGPVCIRCALPLGPYARQDGGCSECRGRSLGFDRVLALGPYQGSLRDLCIMLKQEPNAWLARWLIDLFLEKHGPTLAEHSEALVTPIPLHWWRRWRRGYNQAEALAERLAERFSLRMVRALRRVQPTAKLAGLGRTERIKIMRQAFRVRRAASLKGRTVLLVDDILTTGATCGAAARVLKRAGAAKVVAVVIGRAGRS
jgi:ComF family protein